MHTRARPVASHLPPGALTGSRRESRSNSRHVNYAITAVPLAGTIANLELLVAPQIVAKSLIYGCAGIPARLRVSADADKLQQIMLNLLSNAIKFTPPAARLAGSVVAAGDIVTICGRSTTRGIATGHEELGLGRAISRDLPRVMAGDLTVQGTAAKRSVFALQLARA